MDEDDTATPPDGSSGGGRQIVNHTSTRIADLKSRLEQINNEIDTLEEQQGALGTYPQIDAQIDILYDQHGVISGELDFGSGWEAYDEDAIQNQDDAVTPQPPHPPPPPPLFAE